MLKIPLSNGKKARMNATLFTVLFARVAFAFTEDPKRLQHLVKVFSCDCPSECAGGVESSSNTVCNDCDIDKVP